MSYRWVEDSPGALSALREMFREYQSELGIDLCFQDFENELAQLPGKYAPPNGAILVVADEAGEFMACSALREISPGIGEIKRVYVRPAFRRAGLARGMSVRLIERARGIGYQRLRLDSLRRLTGAIALYESLGFREIAAYNYNPEPDIVYMEIDLSE